MPQLVIALNTPDKNSDYIHITEATPDTTYYCPCCHGKILPRAFSNKKDYKMQSHFYHVSGGCQEEEYVHFICKNWLFESGFEFNVNGTKYTTANILIEKTYTTIHGLYRPDITIETQQGKTFFVEIKNKSKKDMKYMPKWDELGIAVVEIDVQKVINKKITDSIPEFSLIYSDGFCFIKSYTNKKYADTILKRKYYWKEYDKTNYKQLWKNLDLFWYELYLYSSGENVKETVLLYFKDLHYDDQLWLTQSVIKKMRCQDLYADLKDELNKSFFVMLNDLSQQYRKIIPSLSIVCNHISPRIYVILCKFKVQYDGYECFECEEVKVKCNSGILCLNSKNMIEETIKKMSSQYQSYQNQLSYLEQFQKDERILSLKPHSHCAAATYPLSKLTFKIEYHDFINSQYIKEYIGHDILLFFDVGWDKSSYQRSKTLALQKRESTIIKYALKNNSAYQKSLDYVTSLCTDDLSFKISSDFRRAWLLYEDYEVGCFHYTNNDFSQLGSHVYDYFTPLITYYKQLGQAINNFLDRVNNSPNGLWQLQKTADLQTWQLIFSEESCDLVCLDLTKILSPDALNKYLQDQVFASMKKLASGVGNNIRILGHGGQ